MPEAMAESPAKASSTVTTVVAKDWTWSVKQTPSPLNYNFYLYKTTPPKKK